MTGLVTEVLFLFIKLEEALYFLNYSCIKTNWFDKIFIMQYIKSTVVAIYT